MDIHSSMWWIDISPTYNSVTLDELQVHFEVICLSYVHKVNSNDDHICFCFSIGPSVCTHFADKALFHNYCWILIVVFYHGLICPHLDHLHFHIAKANKLNQYSPVHKPFRFVWSHESSFRVHSQVSTQRGFGFSLRASSDWWGAYIYEQVISWRVYRDTVLCCLSTGICHHLTTYLQITWVYCTSYQQMTEQLNKLRHKSAIIPNSSSNSVFTKQDLDGINVCLNLNLVPIETTDSLSM